MCLGRKTFRKCLLTQTDKSWLFGSQMQIQLKMFVLFSNQTEVARSTTSPHQPTREVELNLTFKLFEPVLKLSAIIVACSFPGSPQSKWEDTKYPP